MILYHFQFDLLEFEVSEEILLGAVLHEEATPVASRNATEHVHDMLVETKGFHLEDFFNSF